MLTLAAVLFGCSDEAEKKTAALPDGFYSVSRPVCGDTGKNPTYATPVQPAALRDYVDTNAAEIEVAGADTTATINDADCQLTNRQKISYNSGAVVSFTQNTTNSWSPDGCTLSVEVDGEKSDVDKDLTTSSGTKVYQDITSSAPGGSFDMAASGDTYTLTLGIAINDFGCANGAKFQWVWTKKS
jgi:hypothetical protein